MKEFEYSEDRLREYISRCNWTWAKTMPDIPHEYICRGKCALSMDEFYYFVDAQRRVGKHKIWGQYNHQYLHIDGWKYWTMGNSYDVTKIINRARIFDCFDSFDWPLYRPYTLAEMGTMAATIDYVFNDKLLFECGFGNGDLVSCIDVTPKRYYGVDPSNKAVKYFRDEHPQLARRCSHKSFEEAHRKWLSQDCVVLALFGTPSYFMREYLEMLSKSGKDYCLMFYKDGMVPEEFKPMYPFCYSSEEIKGIFPDSQVYRHKKYMTFSSREMKWQEPKISLSLF